MKNRQDLRSIYALVVALVLIAFLLIYYYWPEDSIPPSVPSVKPTSSLKQAREALAQETEAQTPSSSSHSVPIKPPDNPISEAASNPYEGSVFQLIKDCASLPKGKEKVKLLEAINALPASAADELVDSFQVPLDDQTYTFLMMKLREIADNRLIKKMAEKYDSSSDKTEKGNLLTFLANMQKSEVVDALQDIVTAPQRTAGDDIVLASMRSLTVVGITSSLHAILNRIAEVKDPNLFSQYITEMSVFSYPMAEGDLQLAAKGELVINKDVTLDDTASNYVRMAAIATLHNYPSAETLQLLSGLEKTDPNPEIRALAKEARESGIRGAGGKP